MCVYIHLCAGGHIELDSFFFLSSVERLDWLVGWSVIFHQKQTRINNQFDWLCLIAVQAKLDNIPKAGHWSVST